MERQEMEILLPYIYKIPGFSETGKSGNHCVPTFPSPEADSYCAPSLFHCASVLPLFVNP